MRVADCSLKIFRSSVLNGYHRLFSVVAQKIGVKVRQVSVNHFLRNHGTSNYGFGRTLNIVRHA
jgi:hypothetical protein